MLLYRRSCVLRIGSQEIFGLRVTFKVHRDVGSKPNTCEVVVDNMSETNRAAAQVKGTTLILQAGYGDDVATIFSGQIRSGDTVREGPNWRTAIRSGDGEVNYQFKTVSESFAAGTPKRAVVKHLIDQLGLDAGNVDQKLAAVAERHLNGYVAHGKASVELNKVLTALGFEWSIQDGRVQVLKVGETTQETAVELTPESGLIGSPQHGVGQKGPKGKTNVVKGRSLINPGITPGRKLILKSQNITTTLKVIATDLSGDTHGGDWYVDFEGVPVS